MAASALVAALRRGDRPHTSVASDWRFVLTGIWFVGGLFVDGYAHNHFDNLETFFTPWHAIFYSGLAAVAALSVCFTVRERAIPVGYELWIGTVLVRSALVFGMLFFLMRRFRLPPGAITFLFGVNALLMGFMVEGIPIFYVAGALAGVAADVLSANLDVARDAPRVRAFAFFVPAILFAAYIIGYRFVPGFTGYAWNVNLLVGAPMYAGVTGLLLSYLAWPPLAATSRR